MELGDIYDHVWNLGLLLQSDESLDVLKSDYRAWPKVREGEAGSIKFYAVLHRSRSSPSPYKPLCICLIRTLNLSIYLSLTISLREEDLEELRQYEGRDDVDNYKTVLREVLHLFGNANLKPLERTMGKYLKSTGGIYRNELREEWELEAVTKLLSHNNPAERPFAIVKAYLQVFPTMRLATLAIFSLSMTNGSHRPAGTLGKTRKTQNRERVPPGIALTSPLLLKMAVTKVCGVRRKYTGSVTQMMRETNANLVVLGDNRRKAKHKADMEQKAKLQFNKGVQHNINMTYILANTPSDLEANLELLGHAVGTCLAYLKRQFDARKARADGDKYVYQLIGAQFKKSNGRDLKKTPSNGDVTTPLPKSFHEPKR